MAKIITAEEFESLDKSGAILIDFYADWCGPCQQLGPIIDEVSTELSDVQIYKINVDEPTNKKMAMKNKVMSIPTLLMYKDGEVVNRTNFVSKEDLVDFINNNK